jgi:hypothetical protein
LPEAVEAECRYNFNGDGYDGGTGAIEAVGGGDGPVAGIAREEWGFIEGGCEFVQGAEVGGNSGGDGRGSSGLKLVKIGLVERWAGHDVPLPGFPRMRLLPTERPVPGLTVKTVWR